MRKGIAVGVLLLAVCPAWAASYTVFTVTNANDAGESSLRHAIVDANWDLGTDYINFDEAMDGAKIHPVTPLPAITDPVILDGDIDNNNEPDVSINCSLLTDGCGLTVQADGCVIEGLAVTFAPRYGVYLLRVSDCIIRNCHLGVNLAGRNLAANGEADLMVKGGHANIIGEPGKRNVIAGKTGAAWRGDGVRVFISGGNVVQSNYFGLNRAGTAALGSAGTGVSIAGRSIHIAPDRSENNVVRNNVFAGLDTGVELAAYADRNRVEGNYFGLAADGDSELAIRVAGSGSTRMRAPTLWRHHRREAQHLRGRELHRSLHRGLCKPR